MNNKPYFLFVLSILFLFSFNVLALEDSKAQRRKEAIECVKRYASSDAPLMDEKDAKDI